MSCLEFALQIDLVLLGFLELLFDLKVSNGHQSFIIFKYQHDFATASEIILLSHPQVSMGEMEMQAFSLCWRRQSRRFAALV